MPDQIPQAAIEAAVQSRVDTMPDKAVLESLDADGSARLLIEQMAAALEAAAPHLTAPLVGALVLETDNNAELRDWNRKHKADSETFRATACEMEERAEALERRLRGLYRCPNHGVIDGARYAAEQEWGAEDGCPIVVGNFQECGEDVVPLAALDTPAPEQSQVSSGHRVEIDFTYGSLPGVRLIHPETGCPESEEGDPCFLTDWLENEGAELLRGKLTLPVRWEAPDNRDHPLFHLLADQAPSEDGLREFCEQRITALDAERRVTVSQIFYDTVTAEIHAYNDVLAAFAEAPSEDKTGAGDSLLTKEQVREKLNEAAVCNIVRTMLERRGVDDPTTAAGNVLHAVALAAFGDTQPEHPSEGEPPRGRDIAGDDPRSRLLEELGKARQGVISGTGWTGDLIGSLQDPDPAKADLAERRMTHGVSVVPLADVEAAIDRVLPPEHPSETGGVVSGSEAMTELALFVVDAFNEDFPGEGGGHLDPESSMLCVAIDVAAVFARQEHIRHALNLLPDPGVNDYSDRFRAFLTAQQSPKTGGEL